MTTEAQDQSAPLVAVASADAVLRHPEAGEHLLTDLERERAARFRHESGRTDFTAGHLLVRLCAARLLGVPAAGLVLAQQCPDCGLADHGKPYLPDHPGVHVSLSHTRGVVAAGAGHQPVGVDVELSARGGSLRAVARRVLAPAELALVEADPEPDRAFLRLWVRKESLIKIGRATLDTLGRIDLSALPLAVPPGTPLRGRHEDLHLIDWTDPEHGAAVAAVSTAAPRIVELTAAG
ncbi:4'-phosphopantetheinyl transferase family protein [Kitasatospora sp. NPDC059577]|uniref:4'-phosphopantetheinyl transferase family protein n=1 Tax=Kitasatospora sp. NPDC059577 TaxID=3346873 RepID=UPI0036C6F39E